MLNEQQMRHAHFARSVDMDPRYKDLPEADRGRAWGREMCYSDEDAEIATFAEDMAAEYQQGKAVLAEYTLSYSARFVAGTARPEVPENIGTILVDAGHIATQEAKRIAYFRTRS